MKYGFLRVVILVGHTDVTDMYGLSPDSRTRDNLSSASSNASVGHASACHGAFAVAAVHREHTSGRVPQGWRLLLTRVDSREDCPSSGPFSRHAVLLPQAHACHCLKRPFLTVRGNWFLAVSLTRVPPPIGLCPFPSPSPLSLQILGHCLALSRCSKKSNFFFI